VDAEPTTDPLAIREKLVRQVRETVYWERSLRRMIADGVREFYEIGPGKTVAGMIKRIDETVKITNVGC